MKHCYLILAHDRPFQLKKLIGLLDDPRNSLVLHVDSKSALELDDLASAASISEVRFAPRVDVNWAGFSVVEATLSGICTALELDFDYLHLISGADLPIKTNDEIDRFISARPEMLYVNFAPHNYEFANYKVQVYHPFVDRRSFRSNKAVKALNHSLARGQLALGFRRQKVGNIYHGSEWWSLPREFVLELASMADWIRSRYRMTLASDEVFVQTLLMERGLRDRVYRFEEPDHGNLRLIDWRRRVGNSPHTWRMDDMDALLGADEDYLFARKFDEEVDIEVIEAVIHNVRS